MTCLQQPGNKGTFKEMVSHKKESIPTSQSEQYGRAPSRWWSNGRRTWMFIFLPWAKLPVIISIHGIIPGKSRPGRKHVYELQQLTLHDRARIGYAERFEADLRVVPHLEEPGKQNTKATFKWMGPTTNKEVRKVFVCFFKTKQNNNNNNKYKNRKTTCRKSFKYQWNVEKSVNRVKLSETCKEQKVKVESSYSILLSISLSDNLFLYKGGVTTKETQGSWLRWFRWRISPSSRRRICTGQPPRHCPSKSLSPSPNSVWHCECMSPCAVRHSPNA